MKKFAATLEKSPPPFDKTTGIALAAAAIEVVGAKAHRFAKPADVWQGVAVKVFEKLTTEFAAALSSNARLGQVLSREQFTDTGRIVLTEISQNPTLITESGDEWHGVIVAVTTAMATDDQLLLTSDDWKEIARVASTCLP